MRQAQLQPPRSHPTPSLPVLPPDSPRSPCPHTQDAVHTRKAAPLTLALLATSLCARLGLPVLPFRAAPVEMHAAGKAVLQVRARHLQTM